MSKTDKRKMSFDEIINNKELFLKNYQLEDEFIKSGYTWAELMEIASEFNKNREEKYPRIIQKYISEIATFDGIHSYRYRIKETDSFIKKIIIKATTKNKKVTISNYLTNITDLLGIRLLYVFKEDYYKVHKQLMTKYQHLLVENVHIKLQKGDDTSLYKHILDCGPIPDTLCADENDMKGARLEIQTRTIFEEGWSEINHKLVYKNQSVDDYFVLLQASKILSTLVGNCDTLGTLMKNIYDEYLKRINCQSFNSKLDEKTNKVMNEVLKDFLIGSS